MYIKVWIFLECLTIFGGFPEGIWWELVCPSGLKLAIFVFIRRKKRRKKWGKKSAFGRCLAAIWQRRWCFGKSIWLGRVFHITFLFGHFVWTSNMENPAWKTLCCWGLYHPHFLPEDEGILKCFFCRRFEPFKSTKPWRLKTMTGLVTGHLCLCLCCFCCCCCCWNLKSALRDLDVAADRDSASSISMGTN